MKKIFYFLTIFAALSFAACGEDSLSDELPDGDKTETPDGGNDDDENDKGKDEEEDKSKYPFYLSDDILTFSHEGGIRSVVVTVNTPVLSWGLDNPWDYKWCTVDIHEKSVTFTVSPYTGLNERIAEYKFYCDGYSVIMQVMQLPTPSITSPYKYYFLSSFGCTVEIPIETNIDEYTIYIPEKDKSWITYVETRGLRTNTLVFDIATNDGACRDSYVSLRDFNGKTKATVTIEQDASEDCKIYYTSRDGSRIEPYRYNFGDAEYCYYQDYGNKVWSITFNRKLTEIGEYAFYGCSNLDSITLPDKLASIGSRAFLDTGLTSVTIPDGVTEIGERAFASCSRLTSITIPDSVTEIGYGAFRACGELAAFYGKFASDDSRCLIIDGTLHSFAPAGLTSYTIPDGVTEIGNSAFYRCYNLTSITIPDGVTEIGDSAFDSCYNLTSITIPDSVTEIGRGAFFDCSSLKSVYCKAVNPPALYYSYLAFYNNADGRKIYVPRESVEAYKSANDWKDYAYDIEGYDF